MKYPLANTIIRLQEIGLTIHTLRLENIKACPLHFQPLHISHLQLALVLLDAGVIHSSALNGRYTSEHTNMEI